MRNFAQEIEAMTESGDHITAIVVGDYLGRPKTRPDGPGVPQAWEEARPLLDYEYYAGFGGEDCHAVYVFTTEHVIIVVTYDGATRLQKVPRFPSIAAQECVHAFGG